MRSQRVTQAAVDAIEVGEHLSVIEGTLCPSPQRTPLPGHRLRLLYYVLRTADPVNSTAQVKLIFDKRGRLKKKQVDVK
jgi:hypothetical protein